MYDIPIFQLYISWIYGPGIIFVWEIRTRNSIFPGDMDPEFHLFGTALGGARNIFPKFWGARKKGEIWEISSTLHPPSPRNGEPWTPMVW